jgi:hypothetical protein
MNKKEHLKKIIHEKYGELQNIPILYEFDHTNLIGALVIDEKMQHLIMLDMFEIGVEYKEENGVKKLMSISLAKKRK